MRYIVKSTRKRRHYRVNRTRNRKRNRNRNGNRTRTVNRYRILRGGTVTDEEVEATKTAVNNIFRGFQVASETNGARRNTSSTHMTRCLVSVIEKNNTMCLMLRLFMDPENIFTPCNKLIVIRYKACAIPRV
jgi:hypothetical protein